MAGNIFVHGMLKETFCPLTENVWLEHRLSSVQASTVSCEFILMVTTVASVFVLSDNEG